MTQQIFITARERLNPRWQEAFDKAAFCSHETFGSQSMVTAEGGIFWLDISLLSAEARLPLIQQVVAQVPRLVVMTDEQSESEAFQVMKSGAAGYCHYLAAPEQLREVASVVSKGGLWIGAQLMQKLLVASAPVIAPQQGGSALEVEQHLSQLTPRERMVALEVGKGATNKEIAAHLEITERTVKAHISVIFNKLKVRDRVQLALFINNLSKNSPALSFSTIA